MIDSIKTVAVQVGGNRIMENEKTGQKKKRTCTYYFFTDGSFRTRPIDLVIENISDLFDKADIKASKLRKDTKKAQEKQKEIQKIVADSKKGNSAFFISAFSLILLFVLALVLVLNKETAIVRLPLDDNIIIRIREIIDKMLDLMVAPLFLGYFLFKLQKHYDLINNLSEEYDQRQEIAHNMVNSMINHDEYYRTLLNARLLAISIQSRNFRFFYELDRKSIGTMPTPEPFKDFIPHQDFLIDPEYEDEYLELFALEKKTLIEEGLSPYLENTE